MWEVTHFNHFIPVSSLFQVKSALRFPRHSLEQLDLSQSYRQMKRIRSIDGSRPSSSRSHSKNQRTPNLRSVCSSSHIHPYTIRLLVSRDLSDYLSRKRRCRLARKDSADSTTTSSSSSSSLCSPRTPSCFTPHPCPSSPSVSYNISVFQLPFLDSLSSGPPPSPPQHEQEWKQVRGVEI